MSNQFRFFKSKNTIQAVISVIEDQKDPAGNYNAATFLDIKGTLDGVCWSVVISTLKGKNVPGTLIKTILRYLKDRQVIFIMGQDSINKQLGAGCLSGRRISHLRIR